MRQVEVDGRRMPLWNAGPAFAPWAGGFCGSGLLRAVRGLAARGAWFDGPDAASAADQGDFGDFGGGDFGGGFGGGDFGAAATSGRVAARATARAGSP